MLCCVSATGHDKLIKSLLPLLLALLSACGTTFHGPAGRVDETGRLRCDTQLTAEGVWHCKRGFAHKAQRVDAINAATQAARASLRSTLRGALNAQQLVMLPLWIDTAFFEPKAVLASDGGWDACAVAVVQTKRIDEPLRDESDRLKKKLRQLVLELSRHFEVSRAKWRVKVRAPVWADGTDVALLGDTLEVRLESALAADPRLRLVEDDPDQDWDVELMGKLVHDGTGCGLVLYAGDKTQGWQPLGDGVTFNPLALGARSCAPPPETAISDRRLGLKNGERLGVEGLRVWIEPGHVREGGQVCEGEAFPMVIRSSEPAWLRLYSLDEAGRVLADAKNWCSWRTPNEKRKRAPKPTMEWRLEHRSVLPTPLYLPDAPRDRLVVVALPAGLDPGIGFSPMPEHGVCEGNPLSSVDPSAAITSHMYEVLPMGEGSCRDDQKTRDEVEELKRRADLDRIQACPR
jgi:hypothetical protein